MTNLTTANCHRLSLVEILLARKSPHVSIGESQKDSLDRHAWVQRFVVRIAKCLLNPKTPEEDTFDSKFLSFTISNLMEILHWRGKSFWVLEVPSQNVTWVCPAIRQIEESETVVFWEHFSEGSLRAHFSTRPLYSLWPQVVIHLGINTYRLRSV